MNTTFDCSNYIKIGHLLFYIDITIKGLDSHHLLNPNDGYDGLVALKIFLERWGINVFLTGRFLKPDSWRGKPYIPYIFNTSELPSRHLWQQWQWHLCQL